MSDELYFIPILARAMSQADRAAALRDAFSEIALLGTEPRYRDGLEQFRHFMHAAQADNTDRAESMISSVVRELMMELATGEFPGDERNRHVAMELIRTQPSWLAEFESLCRELSVNDAASFAVNILVSRDEQPVGTVSLSLTARFGSLGSIVPGAYHAVMESGRLIWEDRLTNRELRWREAFPGKPFALAAEIAGQRQPSSMETRLLEGRLVLRTYPGLESGRLEFELLPHGARDGDG